MTQSILSPLPRLIDNDPLALISPYIPEQTLVIHNGRNISQQQFLQDVHRVAEQLPAEGFALNLCEDRYYFLLAFCALLLKGAVNLLPPNRQAAALVELAQDYPDCYCLFDRDQPCELPSVSIDHLLQHSSARDTAPLAIIPAQQTAAIAFTSGSTGKPKPYRKSWETLALTARLLGQRLTADLSLPVLVATVPSQHMYGLETTLMMALQAGAIMHSAKPFYPADLQEVLGQIPGAVLLVSTPIHLRAMVKAELPMANLAGIISATAPLDRAMAQASEHCFNTKLWEIYGCTEAGSMATRRSTQTESWQLLDGFSLRVTAEGAIASAPHLAESAYLQDHLTLHSDTEFSLSGRSNDMINVAGKRASLASLTLQLLRVEGVRDAVVFLPEPSSSSRQQEQRPVALVVSDLPEKNILAALALQIDAAFLPRPLRKVQHLPRNETGKLTAAVLQQLWSQYSE